jgi:hypothetical protein
VRRVLCLLLAASVLLVPLQSAQAVTLTFESEVEVEYNPDTLDLKPGDVRAVYIMVRNLGDRILYFKVEVVGVDASGSSSIDVFNHMFILEPGGVDQVVVTIESRAHFQQDPDVSNVKIPLRWGPNATTIVGGAFRLEDPEFRNSIEYEIEDDFSGQWVWILGIIVIAVGVVTLIVIVKRWRARRKVEEPSVEPYGEGSKGGTDAMTVRHTFTPRITREDGDTRDQVTSDRRVD